MYDQRTSRLKCIGSLDAAETRKIMKKDQRKQIQEKNLIVLPNTNVSYTPINTAQKIQIGTLKKTVSIYRQHLKCALNFLLLP